MRDEVQLRRLKRLRNIGRVASLEYQVRECLGGTAERYVLLDELLETTIYAAEHDASHPVLSRKWTADQQQALLAFARTASTLFDQIGWQDPNVSLTQIIHSQSMQRIREAADECLRRVGVCFTLEELLGD
jgi:hypothetical protein